VFHHHLSISKTGEGGKGDGGAGIGGSFVGTVESRARALPSFPVLFDFIFIFIFIYEKIDVLRDLSKIKSGMNVKKKKKR
jgi:hypothetical protein